jgi:hypothetical protein
VLAVFVWRQVSLQRGRGPLLDLGPDATIPDLVIRPR